ncbi:hypothetical protein ACVWW1_005793 [Bradyrhizobium sp. JR3.5]
MFGCNLVEEFAGEVGDRHRGNGADRMIHLTQDEDVHVADITGQEERHHLAPAILQLLVAVGPAGQDQVDVFRLLAFTNDIDARPEVADALARRAIKNGMINRRKPYELLQFPN